MSGKLGLMSECRAGWDLQIGVLADGIFLSGRNVCLSIQIGSKR